MKTNYLKIAFVAITMLSVGAVNAQITSTTDTNLNKKAAATDVVKLIDNKGTIKYLQSINGITQITSTTAGNATTTTWQLGGTLDANTYIDTNGKVFGLDKIELVTSAAASTDATTNSVHGTGTGWTVVIRDEVTGAFKKIKASDLLQVQAGREKFIAAADATITYTLTGSISLPATINSVFVFRNGAKLLVTDDYTVVSSTGVITLVTANVPVYKDDVIEVQWVK